MIVNKKNTTIHTAVALLLVLSIIEANINNIFATNIITTEQVEYSREQCGGLIALEFDIFKYSDYNKYFDDDSFVRLPQAGVYQGPTDIEEYVRFTDTSSPFIDAKVPVFQEIDLTGFDPETGTCIFNVYSISTATLSNDGTEGGSFTAGRLLKVYYSIPAGKIPRIDIYFTPESIVALFSQLQKTNGAKFVCNVLTGPSCQDTDIPELNGNLSEERCIEKLSMLELLKGENNYFDNNTQGCRYLHSVFAATNPFHCAHLSFLPAKDPKGNFKCQTSANIQPSDLFSEEDIFNLKLKCLTVPQLGTDTCVRLIEAPTPSPITVKPTTKSQKKGKASTKKTKKKKSSK